MTPGLYVPSEKYPKSVTAFDPGEIILVLEVHPSFMPGCSDVRYLRHAPGGGVEYIRSVFTDAYYRRVL